MFLSLYIRAALGQQDTVQVTYFLYQEHVQNIIKNLLLCLQPKVMWNNLPEFITNCTNLVIF